jgi:hypothetical protein
MSWLSIFKKGEILTQGDRSELETLEAKTTDLRKIIDKIDREWPVSTSRQDRLRDLAGQLAETPNDQELLHRLTITACMPSNLQHGYQHRDIVLGRLGEKVEELMSPQHAIIRRVFRRALDVAEAELKRVESKEKKIADDEGVQFVPSGKILALQNRILSLRNEIALPVPNEEGCHQHPGGWRDRLREWV